MGADLIRLRAADEPVAGAQLLSPHPADFAVDQNLSLLNHQLCFAAGFRGVRQLHGVLQFDILRGDCHGNGVILLFDDYLHKPTPFLAVLDSDRQHHVGKVFLLIHGGQNNGA